MWSLTRLRQHPNFAHLFAHVHPLCWLILWWELNRLMRWYRKYQPEDALVSTSVWGFITVSFITERADPDAYRTPQRTFRPLTDASYASDLPANLALIVVPLLARAAGEVAPKGPEGALSLRTLDST